MKLNEVYHLIIYCLYCLNYIRRDQNSTYKTGLRACSYDPAYRDVSLTDDLASYLFSYKILHCVHMRKRAGPLAEISFEFAEIIGRRDENFPYEHASPLTGMKSNKSCRFNLTLFTWFFVCFVNKY